MIMFIRSVNRGVLGQFMSRSGVRFNSSFDQLNNAIKQTSNRSSNSENVKDINDLLNSSLETTNNGQFKSRSNEYGLGDVTPHPRDVAKNIKIQGPMAGRVIDVHYGQVTKAVFGMNRIISQNKIRYLQKIQSRHIPKAKLKKQQRREWWRRKFSEGFKDLMAQVNDARRRGY